MRKITITLLMTILAFQLWSCGESKETIKESELPKYILSPASISNDNLQTTWRITILDSIVTKKQLIALATIMKEDDTQNRESITIHFYPSGVKTDIVAQASVF